MLSFTKEIALVASALCLSSVQTAQAEDIVLGYMPGSMIYPYNAIGAKDFEDEAKKLGARVIVIDPQGTVEAQANGIDDLILQGVKGIAMLPLDGIAAQSWADRAAEAGIPFVSVATQVGDWQTRAWNDVYPNVSALVGMDNVASGEMAGKMAADILPKDRMVKIAIVEGAPGYPQVPQRTKGFRAGLDAAGIKYEIVASQPTDWTAEKGMAVCQAFATSHPDLDLVFSQADPGAVGCAHAFGDLRVKTPIISGDGGSFDGAKAIEEGGIAGSVCDRPGYQGRLAARALMEAVTNPDIPKGRLVNLEIWPTTKNSLKDCPPEY
ncbi:sugar ABC transporter substrate-binding protein (plasmid) [Rhizobium leguminosarum]